MGRKIGEVADTATPAERARRNATLLIASCERNDGSSVKIRISNISETGLKGECHGLVDLEVDELVKVRFRNLASLSAQIVRYENSEIGIRFLRPIDVNRLIKLRATAVEIEHSPRAEAVRDWIGQNERVRQGKKRADVARPV